MYDRTIEHIEGRDSSFIFDRQVNRHNKISTVTRITFPDAIFVDLGFIGRMILMASSIKYTMTEAKILDTLLYRAELMAGGMSKAGVVLFIYAICLVMNFFISSGSAKAFLLIPIIAPLAQLNIDKVLEIAERIVALCREPLCFEEILQRLFTAYALTMNFEQYVLVGSTVRSYLAWLRDAGRLDFLFDGGRMLWRSV